MAAYEPLALGLPLLQGFGVSSGTLAFTMVSRRLHGRGSHRR